MEEIKQNSRVQFIDFGRSVAICMMLQGHFISMSYSNYDFYMDEIFKNGHSSNLLFNAWGFMRGLTAPLFFTISGTVFSFLLHLQLRKSDAVQFWHLKRVKKGIKRGLMLLLIGYVIQINFKYIAYYFQGNVNPHFYTFHVLQCIGLSILALIFTTFLEFKVKASYHWLYALLGICLFAGTFFIRSTDDYLPYHFPVFIQNMIQGPETEFSVFPWMGFVFMGGTFGSLLARYSIHEDKKKLIKFTLLFSIASFSLGWIFTVLSWYTPQFQQSTHPQNLWYFDRLGFVFLLFTLFIPMAEWKKAKHPLFLGMGQNTFFVYVSHAILLYGAFIGYSLRDLLQARLSGISSIIGAILFLVFFALLVKYLPNISAFFRNFRAKLKS
ncbi:MAG: hypothetical protein RIS20_7 [Bacteroidota bacterium]